MNSIVLSGNVGADPEIKYFDSGRAKCTLSLAVKRIFKKKGSQDTDWFSVEIWGKPAESCAEFVKKGSAIGITGRIEIDEFEKDGKKQKFARVTADSWEFMGSKKQDGQSATDDGDLDGEVPF